MAYPATSGKLCTNVKDMAIGDYIGCFSNCSSQGTLYFNALNSPVYDLPIGVPNSDGNFYLIKVDKGLLISDRNIVNWSGNTANSVSAITGLSCTTPVGKVFVRAPSYAEWDQYIVNSDLNGSIVKQDTKVWNTYNTTAFAANGNVNLTATAYGSWLQDTIGTTRRVAMSSTGDASPGTALATVTALFTGYFGGSTVIPCYLDPSKLTTTTYLGNGTCSYTINLSIGYRPVMEYIDNSKSVNVFM